MINRPDRVIVWSSQVAANDFPPICAMSGAPADVWRKFRFATRPVWTYIFLAFGLLPFFLVALLVTRSVTGRLPLTRASRRKLRLGNAISLCLLPVGIALLFIGGAMADASDQTTSIIGGVVVALGFLSLLGFIVGVLVVRNMVGPTGKVMAQQPGHTDKLVELRHVHPSFVAAVNQMHQARGAYYASAAASQSQAVLPGSN